MTGHRHKRPPEAAPEKKAPRRARIPWRGCLLAATPLALLAWYLVYVGPDLVPVPPHVNVPFPPATRLLEGVIVWCAGHPWYVLGFAAALLVPGLALGGRYYGRLTVAAAVVLVFAYLSVSAPIDRLLHGVQNTLKEAEATRELGP
jgi:hypothetical protein